VLFGDLHNHLRGLPVVRVIATHCHPDHIGLADWLCTLWNVPLWMTAGEYAFARMMSAGLPGADGTAMFPHFRKHGLDPAMQEQIQERKSHYSRMVPTVPTSYRRLQEGIDLTIHQRRWQIITGFGHSPEHASLYCADLNILISAICCCRAFPRMCPCLRLSRKPIRCSSISIPSKNTCRCLKMC
jgi:glyoxylase-like metal-dependent hydrolase (beta-lactamase superfamily II)